MKRIVLIAFALSLLKLPLHGQVNAISIGLAGGLGAIKGSALSQTSFSLMGFVELSPSFWDDVDFRFDYTYMRKIDSLFPDNNTNRIYPYLHAITVKVIFRQVLSSTLLLEEGIGPLLLNDRTFSDIDVWNYGVCGRFALGLDFGQINGMPIIVSAGSNFGLTFNNTTASYINYNLHLQYFLVN